MDSDAGALCGIIIVLILLVADFIYSAFTAALQYVSEMELQEIEEKEETVSDAGLSRLKDNMDLLIHTGWLLSAFTYIGAGFLASEAVNIYPSYVVFPVAVIAFYLFGSAIPEMLGRTHAPKWLIRRYRVVKVMLAVLYPVTYVMTAVSHFCLHVFGVNPKAFEPEVTEDEIISMVNEGHEQGVLDASEAEMIQNIFELDDKTASSIMTHRKNITGINGCTNLRDAMNFMISENVSRFPVYEESIDNILGVLHFRDAMKFLNMGSYDNWLIKDIPELLRGVTFIPETRGINDLFRKMQAEKLQLVIVVDEYGQTAGLVTMEDILEEIVGNIQDEYDNEIQMIQEHADGSYTMIGMTPLADAMDILGISLEEEEYDTLNGWLISCLDRIPSDGEQAEVLRNGYLFQIIKVENKMICLVKISKSNEEEKE